MKKTLFFLVIFLAVSVFSANAADMIILKDGNVIEAKIMEIHPTEIRYKRADNLNGPMLILSKDKVLSIKFESGVLEIVSASPSAGQGSGQTGGSASPSAGQASVPTAGAASSGGQQPGAQTLLQTTLQTSLLNTLNTLPEIRIAGNNLKFQFTSDKWTAMLNGESFSTGTIEVENTNDGAILNLKQTHIWPGAVAGKAVGKLASKVPGGAVAGSALNAAGGLAGAVEASGPVIVLGYKAGPPAGLSYLRSTGATPAASPERNIFGEMIQINGGTFTMGSPENEPGRSNNEGPQRQVTVSSFLMGKYPITQKAYQQVMGTKPSKFKGDDLPVERVSWFDALWFCNELSMKEGLSPVYRIGSTVEIIAGSNGYRLPTEAEWEYACRAGTTTPFSTGNNITTNQANYNGNSPYNTNAKGENRKKTTPVARFFGNAWGLYDMHGNVAEWCWDRSGNYPSGEQMDPMGASSGNNRVIRGGSWFDGGQSVRSAYRQGMSPNGKNDVTGFRVARSL